MIKPRIIVTGATGKTGSVVVTELLKAGYPVRAMVHREDGRSAQLKAQGAEISVADISDVERVADALRDVQRAYFCPPYDPYMIQGAVAFGVAAKEARLEHIVGLTQWLASPSHPSLLTRQSWLVNRLFSMTAGVAHTIVNPGFFADSYLVTIGLAAYFGVFRRLSLDVRQKPQRATFERGYRASAAAVLMDPTRHAGKSYRPTGPELLGHDELRIVHSEKRQHREHVCFSMLGRNRSRLRPIKHTPGDSDNDSLVTTNPCSAPAVRTGRSCPAQR
jgi:uncharacterized protein YbjT (DUF2867 family)